MTPPPPTQSVRFISNCFVKTPTLSPHQNRPLHLPPFDLAMLSFHYIQKGLLFPLPPHCLHPGFDRPSFIHSFLEKLKRFLSPTSTRSPAASQPSTSSPGARFIHAALNLHMADILSPVYVPTIIQSFFDHDRAIHHDGHVLSLLSVQVTELTNGVFIGLSMSHAIVLTRWFPENHPGPVSLPYTDDPLSFLARYEAPELGEHAFHFSADAIVGLKAEANRQCSTTKISSFQSLTALVWRCITRACCFPPGQATSCQMGVDNRARLDSPLPLEYFGNSVVPLRVAAMVGELLGSGLKWAARLLHTASGIKTFNPYSVMMGSSPRFNMHGNKFGLGKAVALQSGYAHKFDGKVSTYPDREGGGSIDLEICLPLATMAALEADAEFVAVVTIS
ncbi:hypothetical protein ACJRO7_022402 [Eucalyptus globulus]|uniref:Uncharacterized protein n=1 Tax=Eucalyptus globulus TaxID=34317 RepID=A0ABD3JYY2_EUCGL